MRKMSMRWVIYNYGMDAGHMYEDVLQGDKLVLYESCSVAVIHTKPVHVQSYRGSRYKEHSVLVYCLFVVRGWGFIYSPTMHICVYVCVCMYVYMCLCVCVFPGILSQEWPCFV